MFEAENDAERKKRAGSGEPSCSNEPTHSFELITSLSHTGSPARSLSLVYPAPGKYQEAEEGKRHRKETVRMR